MPPEMALLSTLIGSNYSCHELIFMVPKVFEPLKFDCSFLTYGECQSIMQLKVIVNFIMALKW